MPKVARINKHASGDFHGWAVYCPGCQAPHIYTDIWAFNGDMENPTFTPSYAAKRPEGPADNRTEYVCHSFLTDGLFRFLGDCTHILAGQDRMVEEFKWCHDEEPWSDAECGD